MKKIVFTFGLLIGAAVSMQMVYSVQRCYHDGAFEGTATVAYIAMIISFTLIFLGIRKYRSKIGHGFISFGKALQVGALIAFIAASVYVITWLVYYYNIVPDFMDKYSEYTLKKVTNSGASAAEIAYETKEMNEMKELYKSPLVVILFTYAEIFPMGLLVAIVSALLLKKKKPVMTAH